MADDDQWQQRLAFVSGYVLVFGLAVLKLWPVAAKLQTGININFWTMNFPSQGVIVELWEFWALTSVLGMALTAITFAVGHIVCHGVLLAFPPAPTPASGQTPAPAAGTGRGTLEQLRDLTYKAAFMLLPLMAALAVLDVMMMVAAEFESLLVFKLHFSMHAAGWTSRSLIFVGMMGLFVVGYPLLLSKIEGMSDAEGFARIMGGFALTMMVMVFMWLVVIQTCYTATMKVSGQVFQSSRNDLIEVHINLGGATSAEPLAVLELLDARGHVVRNLQPQDVGEGHYICTIHSHDLPDGRYEISLTYPHLSVSSIFPFLHRHIVQERWFVVTSS